jgi:hypothetical protein
MDEQATHKGKENVLEMTITDFKVGNIDHEGFYPISLQTSRGMVECRYYAAASRQRGAVFVGDSIGGWDTPVRNVLYPGLCHDLSRHNINCLRIKYRFPNNLSESILDILAGVTFLIQDGVESIGLVGHSFGAAAVIQAAAASPFVSTVVSLSPQAFGTEAVDAFRETQSILLVHGTADDETSPNDTSTIFEFARNPKKVIFYKGARHNLDEAAPEVYRVVKEWLQTKV